MHYLLGLPTPPPHNIPPLSHLLPFCSAEERKTSQENCCLPLCLISTRAFPGRAFLSAPDKRASSGSSVPLVCVLGGTRRGATLHRPTPKLQTRPCHTWHSVASRMTLWGRIFYFFKMTHFPCRTVFCPCEWEETHFLNLPAALPTDTSSDSHLHRSLQPLSHHLRGVGAGEGLCPHQPDLSTRISP